MDLPADIAAACKPLFEALPMEQAMERLIGGSPKHTEVVEAVLQQPAIAGRADLAAGLWLYVDDLDRSHSVSQSLADSTGSYWHAIMHRREGDFANSHYWLRRAAEHPLIASDPQRDPHALVDAVAQAGREDSDLAARQRLEWQSLFSWCANRR